MKHNFKRFLSLLLAMAMVIGMFPMTHAHAEEEKVQVLGEKVTTVVVGDSYVICLAGTKNALTNQKGSRAWGTNTLATAVCNSVDANNTWTLENTEDGLKLKNGNSYLMVARNTAELNETGHVFELAYVADAGWTVKSLDTNEYFNNLGDSGSIGGWSGDGTKFDIYTIAEIDADEADPWGKRHWTGTADSETVGGGDTEGEFWKAWDNNPSTHWHTNWNGATDVLTGENSFSGEINFGKAYHINQFSFTPRTNKASGYITKASLYVKENEGDEWKLVAEHAVFGATGDKKTFCFEAQNVQFVKFVAEDANADNSGKKWVAVSEFDINYDETHSITIGAEVPATCGAAGYVPYTCSCSYTFNKTTAAATENHTAGEAVVENNVPATCGADGAYDTVVYCSACNTELSRVPTTVSATNEHTYDNESDADCNVCGAVREGVKQFNSEKLTYASAIGYNGTTAEDITGKVADGVIEDNNSYWAVENTNVENCYIQVDLGGEKLINKVEYTKRYNTQGAGGNVWACTGSLLNYTILVSSDGVEWTTVATGETVDGTTPITFPAVKAAYVKLTSTSSYHWQNPNTAMACTEFAVYKAVCLENEHTPGAAATCTEDQICTTCGAVLDAASHSWDNGVEETPATCTENGVKTFTCTVCGATKTEDIPALGEHTPAEATRENENAATCTDAGSYEEVVYCSVCKTHEISRETKTIDPLGHIDEDNDYICDRVGCDFVMCTDHSYDNDCDAECNNCGATRIPEDHVYDNACDVDCNECGDERDVPGHVYDNACDVDCNECGATRTPADHVYTNDYDSACNECGATREVVKKFTSELINHEKITGEASSNDANDGSSIEEAFDGIKDQADNYWASVHNNNGIDGNEHLIANLGGTYLINQVAYTSRTTANAVGNLKNFTIWVSTDKNDWVPVATGNDVPNPGTITVTFDPIEAAYVKLTATESWYYNDGGMNKVMAAAEFEIFKAVCVEHTPGAPATCTEDQICTTCGTVLAAASHSWNDGEQTKAPTCTEEGVKTYTCTVCGATSTETINATGEHAWDNACDTDCNYNCGTTREIEHQWNEGVQTKAPTCTEEGVKTSTCTVCGATSTETIDATGEHAWDNACDTDCNYNCGTTREIEHQWNEGVQTKAPTCTEEGVKTYTCTVCGGTKTEPIPATGHVNTSLIGAKEATCGADGYTGDLVCDKCGVTVTPGTAIPATGNHTYDNDQDTDCNDCGYIREVAPALPNGYMSSMTMANSLNMNFCFEQDLVEDWTGCYAVLVKENGATQTVSRDAWKTITVDGVACFYATYTNLAAKEMTDEITVTIYNAGNEVIAGPFTDTVRDHAIRNLQKTESDLNKTMVMDMLNYGAAAQLKAGYKTDTLANAGKELDAYRQFATESVVYTNEMTNDSNTIKYLANVRMVDNLKFMMAFYGVDETMSLRISYKHWNSKDDEIVVKNIAVKELAMSGSYYVVILDDTVVADARQVITVEVLDANSEVVATITDSIASYAARASVTADPLYEAIMKFATSAKAYLQSK